VAAHCIIWINPRGPWPVRKTNGVVFTQPTTFVAKPRLSAQSRTVVLCLSAPFVKALNPSSSAWSLVPPRGGKEPRTGELAR
jgi:hypothetical protein